MPFWTFLDFGWVWWVLVGSLSLFSTCNLDFFISLLQNEKRWSHGSELLIRHKNWPFKADQNRSDNQEKKVISARVLKFTYDPEGRTGNKTNFCGKTRIWAEKLKPVGKNSFLESASPNYSAVPILHGSSFRVWVLLSAFLNNHGQSLFKWCVMIVNGNWGAENT